MDKILVDRKLLENLLDSIIDDHTFFDYSDYNYGVRCKSCLCNLTKEEQHEDDCSYQYATKLNFELNKEDKYEKDIFISMTYEKILEEYNWDKFCELKGVSEYAVNEGGGHCIAYLTKLEAKDIGIL